MTRHRFNPVQVANLGFPRIGPRRELKAALERRWAGEIDDEGLQAAARSLRAEAWRRQAALGVDVIPSNDFSLYDHVLDTTAMVGALPPEYGARAALSTYFAVARGGRTADGATLPAAEMTKWFDTNYHYLVPELSADQTFRFTATKPLDELLEARSLGVETRPVLLGPVTWLRLAKTRGEAFDQLDLLPRLLPVYAETLRALARADVGWVQMDEPCLALDLDDKARQALRLAYNVLSKLSLDLKLMLTTYFGGLGENLETALALPVHGLHLDLVRAPESLAPVLAEARPDLVLSLGVVDGRNVWRTDLDAVLDRIAPACAGERRLLLAPSCSLLHAPLDLERETGLDPELKSWLAFAVQKLGELKTLARALNEGPAAVQDELASAREALAARRASPRLNDPAVRARAADTDPALARRGSSIEIRRRLQAERLGLPPLPTTTIGSFPQTAEVRKARADHDRGEMDDETYEAFLRAETRSAVRWQESVGLDVLVHGEFERNDMVQYFGEQLSGFAFTKAGWVQSYGSRCVRPPILYGDVARAAPMTVEWWRFAQDLTERPMKGMLTGPVTMLNWSFVRDDQPRSQTCRQIAFALRDEVCDLAEAGAAVIQIDEAALREGLPLRRADWNDYLDWATECFRIAASGVADAVQIHTHMCYSEFNDIIGAVASMDADVVSIETARSRMELLQAFDDFAYPGEIGPGVYDIHAPRTPTAEEMTALLDEAARRLPLERLWVNPDCGLKTRRWEEVRPAIVGMVAAARAARARIA